MVGNHTDVSMLNTNSPNFTPPNNALFEFLRITTPVIRSVFDEFPTVSQLFGEISKLAAYGLKL